MAKRRTTKTSRARQSQNKPRDANQGVAFAPFKATCDDLRDLGAETVDALLGGDSVSRKTFAAERANYRSRLRTIGARVPFGEQLLKYIGKTESGDGEYREAECDHLVYVIAGIAELADYKSRIFREAIPDAPETVAHLNQFMVFRSEVSKAAAETQFQLDHLRLVRIAAALYHDIGKSIARERHPYEGYHIINALGALPLRGQNSRWTWGVSRSNLTMI